MPLYPERELDPYYDELQAWLFHEHNPDGSHISSPSGGGIDLPFLTAENDYGITPHPTNDQTAAINTMIEDVNSGGGATVGFSPGIYRGNFLLLPGVTLWYPRAYRGYYDGQSISKTHVIFQGMSTASDSWVVDTPSGAYGSLLAMGLDGIDILGPNTNPSNNTGAIRLRAGVSGSSFRNFSTAFTANQGVLVEQDATSNNIERFYVHLAVLNRSRSDFIGAVEDWGQDTQWSHGEASTNDGSDTLSSANGYLVGVSIRGNAQEWHNVVGQISDSGFYVGGLTNRVIQCRGDLSHRHDWIIAGNQCMVDQALALNGSRHSSGDFDGFHLTDGSIGCEVYGKAVQTNESLYYRHLLRDESDYGSADWGNTREVTGWQYDVSKMSINYANP